MGSISKDKIGYLRAGETEGGKVRKGSTGTITARYHNSEITVYEYLIRNAVRMVWAGIIMMIIGAAFSMSGGYAAEKLITVFPGGFVTIMSGTILFLVNKSAETKQKYFDSLSKLEHEREIIQMIQQEENSEFRERAIEKVLDK